MSTTVDVSETDDGDATTAELFTRYATLSAASCDSSDDLGGDDGGDGGAGVAPAHGLDRRELSELRDRLIREHAPVARNIARRFARRGESLDDLEQVAMIGLINAVDRYDPGRGEFLSFAVPTITGEVRRHFRDHGWAARVPRRLKDLHVTLSASMAELSQQLGRAPTAKELARHAGVPLDDVIESLHASASYRSRSLDGMLDADEGSQFEAGVLGRSDPAIELMIDLESLAPAVAELPERERTILVLRFYQNLTQTQIAEKIGVSQMHVSRLLSRTLAKLRSQLDPAD